MLLVWVMFSDPSFGSKISGLHLKRVCTSSAENRVSVYKCGNDLCIETFDSILVQIGVVPLSDKSVCEGNFDSVARV